MISAGVESIRTELKDGLRAQRLLEEKFDAVVSRSDREEVLDFFGKVSPAMRHQTSQALRHPNTGSWLVHSDELQEWGIKNTSIFTL